MPLFHEDDVLFKTLKIWARKKRVELLSLLREVVKGMPEGEEMLKSITSRLYVLQEGEIRLSAPDCHTAEGDIRK